MIISFLDKGNDSSSWNSCADRKRWSDDICISTHGSIQFRNDENSEELHLYILEFYLFLKAAIINTLGESQFEENLVLSLSGERIRFEREGEQVRLSFSHHTFAKMTWDQFVADFLRFEKELRDNFAETFPLLSKSNEFALLFGNMDK